MERLDRLSRLLDVFIVTSDTRGNAERVTKGIKAKLHKIKEGDECTQKLELVRKIGEMEIKKEYRGKIVYQDEERKEDLIMEVMLN